MSRHTDYDLIVLGGGAAGLTAAGIGANFGAKTLLVEAARLGGDCTWYGCVPSKSLLRAAAVLHQGRVASRYGLADGATAPGLDFARLIDHVQRVREGVYDEADHPSIYERMGIDVAFGRARFAGGGDARTVVIAGADGGERRVRGRNVIIATGGRAAVPPVAGLADVPYLTNETLFEQRTLPRRLAVLGGGPIGVEMAQAFARLGSAVTVFQSAERILPKDDPELAALVADSIRADGVRLRLGAKVTGVSADAEGGVLSVATGGGGETFAADALLVAAGRRPNIESLDLDAAGVRHTPAGVTVDERCRTNVPGVYAIGDVTGRYQFTHMSEHMAKVAATNALLRVPMKIDAGNVPWCTFTDPELAQVGATGAALRERGVAFEVYRFPFARVDRAITDGETAGMIKVYAKKWSGRILGASICGPHAGDLIAEYAVAMRNGVSLRQVADTIHPYPTYALGNRRAADQWYVRTQSASLVKLVRSAFGYRGALPDLSDPGRVV